MYVVVDLLLLLTSLEILQLLQDPFQFLTLLRLSHKSTNQYLLDGETLQIEYVGFPILLISNVIVFCSYLAKYFFFSGTVVKWLSM